MSTKILDQHAEFIELVHWNNTQSEGRHVAPLAHIILLPNQPGSNLRSTKFEANALIYYTKDAVLQILMM
jgi:hypothetical protein